MTRNNIILITNFLVFVVLQVLVFKNVVLFEVSFVFVYLIALLALPLELSIISAMLLGFFTGLTVDIFYNTLGIHASACVLLMFLRPYWMNTITPRSGYEPGDLPLVRTFGLGWFISYALPLMFIHHLAVFVIEAGGFDAIGLGLLKALASCIVTLVFIVSIQYLFFNSQR